MVRFGSEISSSSSSSSSLSLPSSSSFSRGKYDVFLSYRGEDTRKNFTDHLYAALKRRGIITFKDDEKLETGEAIAPELSKAIQESWCSVIVFSERFASSSWCLEELCEIIKQKNERGHKVFPIFYDVDPSDLRKQTGKVQEAFAKHEENFKENNEKTQRWRIALTEVANIKGWHFNNRHESEFIEDIIKRISTKLCQTYSSAPNDMIGIKSRSEMLCCKIDIGGKDDHVRIIGVCGMGGIGKTALARFVYTQASSHFEGKSFLADVREVAEKYGLVRLQKQLLSQILSDETFNIFDVHEGNGIISRMLSRKKVLIVIDDADNIQHLKCLIGKRGWFGLGSRIIITTRDEHLLQIYGVDDVYKPTTLNANEALRLFSLKAFRNDAPEQDFVEFSKHVVEYAHGLPLALEVLGSFLCGRDAAQWKSAISRLKMDSKKEILDRLQISFDGLEEREKNIFLDIACFFKGDDKDMVTKILEGCEFFPDIGIDVLIKKSLITVNEDNKLSMHDLLQEMGRKIVRQKSIGEPGKRCRLWEDKDTCYVLTNNTATEAVEGMVIDNKGEQNKTFTLTTDAFFKMKKLRLLRVFNCPNFRDLKYLSSELRLLEWHGYPFKSLPSNFQPENLVALFLPHSHIEHLWKRDKPLNKLKLVNVKDSQSLIKTPDFRMAPNLESLILEGTRIVDVHPTIGFLRRLKLLNLRNCKSLRSFPTKIGKESLETLILSGCLNIKRIPEIVGEMECLVELYLDGTGIEELPSSIGHLKSLMLLNLKDCSNLMSLPSTIGGCKCLKTLDISGCSKVENLPVNLQQIEAIEELDLSETAIRTPPSFIFKLKNLKVLSLKGCKGSPSKIRSHWPFLSKVTQRVIRDSMALTLPVTLSGLSALTELNLSDCNLCDGVIPDDIGRLSLLETLRLGGNNFISLPTTLSGLSKLTTLCLTDCENLKSLPDLPISTELWVDGCASLEDVAISTVAGNSILKGYICGINCFKLAENNNVLSLLKRCLKVTAYVRRQYDIFLPGSEIPQWFSHQNDESTNSIIKMPLPHPLMTDSQFIGFAWFCVFFPDFNNNPRRVEHLFCRAILHGRNSRELLNVLFHLEGESTRVTKDHIWLRYWCPDELDSFLLEEECEGADESLEIEFIFKIFGERSKLKKCGIRIVYEKDLEETDQIIDQHNRPTSSNFNDIHPNNGLTGNMGDIVERKRLNDKASYQPIEFQFCKYCEAYI